MKRSYLFTAVAALSLSATAALAGSGQEHAAAANNAVSDQAAARQGDIATGNAEAQGQYAADMAAYRDALVAQHHAANHDQRVYEHQQRAYADAMAAWRHQTWACHHGHNDACRAPTPDPAAFW